MNDIWWKLIGYTRIRLTAADPEQVLRLLTKEYRLLDITAITPLETEFTVSAPDWKRIEPILQKRGISAEERTRSGLPVWAGRWLRFPLIAATVIMLTVLTLWLPSRVFFIRVEGNEQVPERYIIEEAARCGLSFAARRETLRSEQIKNQLLERIPELSWVGVNTTGCEAVISVRERAEEPEENHALPGNIVSETDAVVTEVIVRSGSAQCAVGDAVTAGQVLISGYTDLGLCTHVEIPRGEVYGLTRRESEAVIPSRALIPGEERELIRKYSMIFGKKRINFYSDSGILYAGCGKMTQVTYLQLPGGWTLPVALVVETYTISQWDAADRWEEEANRVLEQCSKAMLAQKMIAGQIIREEMTFFPDGGLYRLNALYECREMIGRYSSGIQTEGDQNDRKNSERGAG